MVQKLLLLALAAAALAGCVGAPGQEPPLTVELHDVRALPPQDGEGPALEAPREPTPPAPASPATQPGTPVTPVPVEVAPALPARDQGPDAQPALAVPVVPPAPSPQPAQAPVPRPAAQAQARPAAAAPASSALAPATPASPAPAPTAAAPAAPATPAAASAARVREVYARQGDELQIGLEGRAFLFLGFPDSGPQREGMSFKGKETKGNKSTFTFKALKLGDYDLEFLQQDNSTGKSARETVRVHVVADAEFAAATGGPAAGQGVQPGSAGPAAGGGTSGAPGAKGDYEHAEKLAALGARQAALEEFLKGYEDGNGWLNDRIATLYFEGGDVDAAEKYWARNVGLAGRPGEQGTRGMVRVALARNDQKGFIALLKPFLAIRELSIEEELIGAARLQQKGGVPGVGLDLAAEYARRYPGGRYRDEAQWLTGQLLEMESPLRDIARARDVYRALLAEWPESGFAERARERVRWIEEHFFTVR